MKPVELMEMLDTGMVDEVKMYYHGKKVVCNLRTPLKTMPDYDIVKMWNSEDGRGISMLLADNTEEVWQKDEGTDRIIATWEKSEDKKNLPYECSYCGVWQRHRYRYCPVCGAKMM